MTAYTPYQPEIAQGTLQYLFEFQTQVAALTGMEVANASMYDGSTAAAEAVLMAHRLTKRKKAALAGGLHPHYRAVIETISRYSGFQVEAAPADPENCLRRDLRRGNVLHRRADARCVRAGERCLGARGESARRGRALDRRRHGGGVIRRAEIAGRDGRRHRRGGGPVHRQRPQFRRPLSWPLGLPQEVRAANAGPPLRRDGRTKTGGAVSC